MSEENTGPFFRILSVEQGQKVVNDLFAEVLKYAAENGDLLGRIDELEAELYEARNAGKHD